MIILKIVLITALTIIFLIFSFSERYKLQMRLFLIASYIAIFTFILSPKLADKIAAFFSVKTGSDLIIYLTIATLALICAILYARIKYFERYFTILIRKDAIDSAKQC